MNIFGKKQIITFILCASLFALALSPVRSAASTLTLAWDPNTEDDLAGYKIYYGTQTGDYDFVIDVGDITQYTVPDLDPETQYYFAVTAYDTSSNESDFSAEVSETTDPVTLVISGLGETSGGWIEAFAEDYSHADWLRVGWADYNSANGEARIATGDIDGDGRDEIVLGLGPVPGAPNYPGGWFEVLDDDYSHLAWGRVNWPPYNSANGETRPACGDVDGDGTDEIIIGLGPYPASGGWIEVFKYTSGSVVHNAWARVNWREYNSLSGETRPSCGDVDGDGRDEIVIGLGPVYGDTYYPGGWFEIRDDDYSHLAWGRVKWSPYNSANGETRPACGDVDGDGRDEIVIGLGPVSGDPYYPGGWLEVFKYTSGSVVHNAWARVNWKEYNSLSGETRPACGDVDGDGRDEIVIGLGSVSGNPSIPGGWFEIRDDDYSHLAWGRIKWSPYNITNGETWPALKQ